MSSFGRHQIGVRCRFVDDPQHRHHFSYLRQTQQTAQPDDFYRDSHRAIFRAIRALSDKTAGIDPLTVCAELERQGTLEAAGGKAYVYQLVSAVPSAGNARHYAKLVKDQMEHGLHTHFEVDRYVPTLRGTGYEGVSIRDVLQMSSGARWDESYSDPQSDSSRLAAVLAFLLPETRGTEIA